MIWWDGCTVKWKGVNVTVVKGVQRVVRRAAWSDRRELHSRQTPRTSLHFASLRAQLQLLATREGDRRRQTAEIQLTSCIPLTVSLPSLPLLFHLFLFLILSAVLYTLYRWFYQLLPIGFWALLLNKCTEYNKLPKILRRFTITFQFCIHQFLNLIR